MKAPRAFSLFLLTFCQILVWGQARTPHVRTQSTSLPDLIERVRPSIASIEFSYVFHTVENPSTTMRGNENGTGFIFDADGHIATAGTWFRPNLPFATYRPSFFGRRTSILIRPLLPGKRWASTSHYPLSRVMPGEVHTTVTRLGDRRPFWSKTISPTLRY